MNETVNPRIAVTGMGMISPCGNGLEAFEEALMSGKSGIGQIDLFPGEVPPGSIGGQCREFNDSTIRKQYLKPQRKSVKVMCRDIQLGVASANLALEDSGLGIPEEQRPRLGVEFGADLMLSPPDVMFNAVIAARGEAEYATDKSWGDQGIPQMEPLWLLKYLPNMPACHISIYARACGPSNSLTLEEASGNLTLGESLRIIRRGQADAMIAGTTGALLHIIKSVNYTKLKELAEPQGEAPETVLKPFDKHRRGEVVSEAAGALILEQEDVAQARDARIYGYIHGIGSSCVRDPQTGPNYRQAIVNAMRLALRSAGLKADQIGHVNAHGCGSIELDAQEAAAILDVFGDVNPQIPVTSLKPFFGNCGSGCGTLEIAASLIGLNNGVVLPTLNYTTPDPACPINVVHGKPLPIENKFFINVNVTRAGQASALVVESV